MLTSCSHSPTSDERGMGHNQWYWSAKQLLVPSYPKPLLNLAISRCLGPHNQVQTILHYLTNQANLLVLNREHI